MTLRTFIFRSLRFHARSHLGVMIGAAIATAALTGALLVGDSMRASLRQRALGRLGWVRFAMAPQDRFFSTNLLNNFVPGAAIPPEFASIALSLPGTAARGDGSARANNVKILGVDDNFWRFPTIFRDIPSNSVVLSAALAAQLHVRRGDEVLLRCRKPSAMSREMAVTPHNEETIAFRLQVHVVAEPESMGEFTLRSEQTPALNAFMRLDELGAKLDLKDKANLLLAGSIHESEARARRSFMLDRVHGWLWLHQPGLAQRF